MNSFDTCHILLASSSPNSLSCVETLLAQTAFKRILIFGQNPALLQELSQKDSKSSVEVIALPRRHYDENHFMLCKSIALRKVELLKAEESRFFHVDESTSVSLEPVFVLNLSLSVLTREVSLLQEAAKVRTEKFTEDPETPFTIVVTEILDEEDIRHITAEPFTPPKQCDASFAHVYRQSRAKGGTRSLGRFKCSLVTLETS